MSWEIKLNWDECPYLKDLGDILKCRHIKSRKLSRIPKCNKKNCPIKEGSE